MKATMRAVCFMAAFLPLAASAGGFCASYRLDSGLVAVTNAQENSSWAIRAVLFSFPTGADGAVTVRRVSDGNTFALATRTFTAATNLVWVADTAFSFGFGDVLVIESTATNGVVQVMRKED